MARYSFIGHSRALALVVLALAAPSRAFLQNQQLTQRKQKTLPAWNLWSLSTAANTNEESRQQEQDQQQTPLLHLPRRLASFAAGAALVVALSVSAPSWAENELSDKYGGKGFDSSLVDQTCLVDKCSIQAKACLADDPSCRKGLTCTAKCMGDNSCITGCMARYGNANLDSLLKCTVEDHECIKIAILPGGSDPYGQEPRAPKATVQNFDYQSLQGSWYKVVGFNPNYDCYACQRNTFSMPVADDNDGASGEKDGMKLVSTSGANVDSPYLHVGVEFAMPHLLPDGSPPPPRQVRESMAVFKEDIGTNTGAGALEGGFKSIGLNEYHTNEVMVFDSAPEAKTNFVVKKANGNQATYARTAHSEGEMFGLKFWENWYVIGENDPGMPEFKFIYYNGKTRQNTYDGAFVYSRSRSLEPESMAKVYAIAKEAGMNPNQFCRIRNGCFEVGTAKSASAPESSSALSPNSANVNAAGPGGIVNEEERMLRGVLVSTKVSELLGVESVSAEIDTSRLATSEQLQPPASKVASSTSRPWWFEVGDYLENPRRHFEVMDALRKPMEWPEHVRLSSYTP